MITDALARVSRVEFHQEADPSNCVNGVDNNNGYPLVCNEPAQSVPSGPGITTQNSVFAVV
jgi:hypothetical protein